VEKVVLAHDKRCALLLLLNPQRKLHIQSTVSSFDFVAFRSECAVSRDTDLQQQFGDNQNCASLKRIDAKAAWAD